MGKIIELHPSATHCSRCGTSIKDRSTTTTITVSKEVWRLDNGMWRIETLSGRANLVFCDSCSAFYDFEKVAVGRRITEEHLVVMQQAEEALTEHYRAEAAQALGVAPEDLTAGQIEGWRGEQEYEAIMASASFDGDGRNGFHSS